MNRSYHRFRNAQLEPVTAPKQEKPPSIYKGDVESTIDGKVRCLKKQDFKPMVQIQRGKKPVLVITRLGNTESLPISRRVVEELIAAGFSYGN